MRNKRASPKEGDTLFMISKKIFILFFSFQMMYADSYMSKEEFRQMFDHTLYDEMRQKYDCFSAFPDVYDKVNKKARSGK